VDAGHAVNLYAAHYGLPMEIAHVARPLAPAVSEYSVAGNINESNDVFAEDVWLPELREGDFLALLPAGAYGSSMASDHCLRGGAAEVAL
jgi:diaminopimelate decarboxylase